MRRDFLDYRGLERDKDAALDPTPSRPNRGYALVFTDNQTGLKTDCQQSRKEVNTDG